LLYFKVKPKARPPSTPPPLRLVAERFGVPQPPDPVYPGATAKNKATASSSSSSHRVREPSGEEEIRYAPPDGRYHDEADEEVVEIKEEDDVMDDEFEEVEVEEDEPMEGRIGIQVVDSPAPWAGLPHKGKGRGKSKGAVIRWADDGGLLGGGFDSVSIVYCV
jgi:hypothetical protein